MFITHYHYDHIYGLLALLEKYLDCIRYTSADRKEGLASDRFYFSRYHGYPITYHGENVQVLDDGDSIELFDGVVLTAILTPGHEKS